MHAQQGQPPSRHIILVLQGSTLSFWIISSPMLSAVIEPPEGFSTLSIFPVMSASTVEYSNASVVFISLQFFMISSLT